MQILNVTHIFKEDSMKSYIKGFALFILSLITTILIYPFLHELGHVIATILVGIEFSEFHLFPVPYVLCNMVNAGRMEYFVVGFAGVLFPFVVSQLLRITLKKNVYIDLSQCNHQSFNYSRYRKNMCFER